MMKIHRVDEFRIAENDKCRIYAILICSSKIPHKWYVKFYKERIVFSWISDIRLRDIARYISFLATGMNAEEFNKKILKNIGIDANDFKKNMRDSIIMDAKEFKRKIRNGIVWRRFR